MHDTVPAQIRALQRMTVSELRERWLVLYGEPARSRNKDFLWRRLAWRVQEMAYGGLSDRAKSRLAELSERVSIHDLRVRPPRGFDPRSAAREKKPAPAAAPRRDPRLPKVGAELVRPYKGKDIGVRILDDGFEWNGRRFDSLSAVALAVTGSHWNGWLFFGLTARSRKG